MGQFLSLYIYPKQQASLAKINKGVLHMLNFLTGCGTNSSCDVLTYAIVLYVVKNCLGKMGGGRGCGCEHECRPKCFDFKIDICTIILLVVMFGGTKLFNFGNKCC